MRASAQIIIFSKDRPAQLELLLRSLQVAYLDPETAPVTILYRSNAHYTPAYLELARHYGKYQFADESKSASFKAALLAALDPAARIFMFLVDDQVFLRPFRLGELLESFAKSGRNCATVSLRLHPGVGYSYCFRAVSPPQTLNADTLEVRWADEPANSDWSVVMSLDGNLYRREDLFPILSGTDYANPCFLEHQMVHGIPFSLDSFYLCQREPIVVTVPLNQTQDTHHHRHGGLVDLAALNQAYLDGSRIALLPYWETSGAMIHREQAPLLLAPAKSSSSATKEIILDANQPLPQLLVALETAALSQPRPAIQLLNASAAAAQPLLQAYASVLSVTSADSSTQAPATVVPTGAMARAEWQKTWKNDLQQAEERVMAGPQTPLSQFTVRNLRPVPPPLPTFATRFQATVRHTRRQWYRSSRQYAYDKLSALAWRLGKPAAGGLRDKLVTLFAGRAATLAEVQRDRPPLEPWKLING